MRVLSRWLVGGLLAIGSQAQAGAAAADGPRLQWDAASVRLIQAGGGYARMVRAGQAVVCCYEFRRRVAVRRSTDDGRTWGPPVDVAGYDGGAAANPELLATREGPLLLFYNGRPRGGGRPFTIAMAASPDGGQTWAAASRPLYTAGTRGGDGCYEPAAVQLPSGEVQLFFANEHGHAADHTQEVDRLRSGDAGRTWSAPECVSYRPGGRDGMPVPLLSPDGRSVLLAVEDDGLPGGHRLRPAVERLSFDPASPVGGTDPRRWPAVTDPPWPPAAYAGAPYLRQFPAGGPSVLACQPDVGHPGVQRLAVFLGDPAGRRFADPTEPFPPDAAKNAQWNALFIRDATTVTAMSTTAVNGTFGVWAVDGHLVRRTP